MNEIQLKSEFETSLKDAKRLLKKRGSFKQNYVEYVEKSFDTASKKHGKATSKILNAATKRPLTIDEAGILIDSFVYTLGALQTRVCDPINMIIQNESAAEFMKDQFSKLGTTKKSGDKK